MNLPVLTRRYGNNKHLNRLPDRCTSSDEDDLCGCNVSICCLAAILAIWIQATANQTTPYHGS
ncbi:hypothetical protein [Nostoc sp. JL33]|uniref:hypothetical protein n=1 Tax=Nostoc sp. JL33 TaxID=2815396 RepID=UPI002600F26E|nr:hypothetical protein [Nostoc sp. JL33]MBN3873786.1 hypothetical protein [Nostoc sp. JL33]